MVLRSTHAKSDRAQAETYQAIKQAAGKATAPGLVGARLAGGNLAQTARLT